MDPVSAVGFASAIVSFIPLGLKLLQNVREIKNSIDGNIEQNKTRQIVIEDMQDIARRLETPNQDQIAPEQRKLCELADQCHKLSQQILILLKEVKPKSQTAAARYRSAFQVWWKESDIKDLEKSVGDCRDQLLLRLVDLSNQTSAAYSERILTLIKDDSDKLKQLQSHLDKLKKDAETRQTGWEACDQLGRLVEVHEEVLCTIYQHRILQSLRFDEMHERDDRIHDPHGQTYKWILQDDRSQDDEGLHEEQNSSQKYDVEERRAMMVNSRQEFLNWLSSSGGIFHITGKLGSGKSTLMKFLCTHPRSQAELRKWAGEKSLVFAKFFFWNPGRNLQNSINGLYRSLLHDVFEACPHLIPYALPEFWEESRRTPWQFQKSLDIPAEVIKVALERVIADKSLNNRLFESHRFCFFIDGLDEHEEMHDQDHVYLVRLLNGWIKESHGNLKICVSSRDYNVFLNGFSDSQRLLLPELTWFDMRAYVRDALMHLPSQNLRQHFINEIPRKADGIFLWSVLVVGDIRRQIENDVPEKKLLQLLDSLPPGLETLFQHVLSRLDEKERRRAYQVMKLLMLANGKSLYFNLANFSFLDNYDVDTEFSIKDDFPSPEYVAEWSNVKPLTYARQLRGICSGLVESGSISGEISLSTRLEFSHRSVPDMLQKRSIKLDMENILGSFNSIEALSHLKFAEVQLTDPSPSNESKGLCAGVATMRLEEHIDKPPYLFLETMESWVGGSIQEPRSNSSVYLISNRSSYIRLGCIDTEKPMYVRDNDYDVYSTLYLAIHMGNLDYAKWKIDHTPVVLDSRFKRSLLAALTVGPPFPSQLPLQDLDYLFERGLLTNDSNNNLSMLNDLDQVVHYISENNTTWHRYLASNFLLWCGLGRATYHGHFNADGFSHIAMRFLEYGEATDFSVTVDNRHMDSDEITFHLGNKEKLILPRELVRRCTLQHTAVWLRRDGKKTLSLRGWIEAMDLKNKEYLLGLIDGADLPSQSSELGASEVVELDNSPAERRESCARSDAVTDQIFSSGHEDSLVLTSNLANSRGHSQELMARSIVRLGLFSGIVLTFALFLAWFNRDRAGP